MYDLVLVSNSKDYWEGFGYLIETVSEKKNFIISTSSFDSLTEYDVLLEQSEKYKYILSVDIDKCEIIINSKTDSKNDLLLNFFLSMEFEEIEMPISLFPNTNLDISFYDTIFFQNATIKEKKQFQYLMETTPHYVTDKTSLYKFYHEIALKSNVKLVTNGFSDWIYADSII